MGKKISTAIIVSTVLGILGSGIFLYFKLKSPNTKNESTPETPVDPENYHRNREWEEKEDNADDYAPDYVTSTAVTKDNYDQLGGSKRSYKKSRKGNSKKNRRSKKRGKK